VVLAMSARANKPNGGIALVPVDVRGSLFMKRATFSGGRLQTEFTTILWQQLDRVPRMKKATRHVGLANNCKKDKKKKKNVVVLNE
jgi:nitric oxide synthase oxygenase domain/subunit